MRACDGLHMRRSARPSPFGGEVSPPHACFPSPSPLQIWSLMNLAFASHEIISDYTTAAFMWFEGG